MALSGIVLITGGAGFIGSHIASALVESGATVRVIDNLATGYEKNVEAIGPDVDFVKADVADDQALNKVLRDVELIFHEAAIPSVPRSVEKPAETHKASVDATFKLLLAARHHKVRRVIYAASSSAYGDQPELPKREDMRPAPLSPYAVAKLVGEYYCQVFTRVYGLETVSLRYFNVFGPRQDPTSQYSGVISRFMSALMNDAEPVIYGDGEHSRDFTYISNVVDANLRAAESRDAVGKIINIANGQRTTLNELLETMKTVTGKSQVTARHEPPRAGDVRDSLADLTQARALLGYEPRVNLEDGLRLTFDWWQKNN
ncbi:MAG TPA: SDR family oxidoreductase [Pyrinomonadaceae bacterium]|nr:SDR family oxidoreductase [Pyrinomonadaceae bacterium]